MNWISDSQMIFIIFCCLPFIVAIGEFFFFKKPWKGLGFLLLSAFACLALYGHDFQEKAYARERARQEALTWRVKDTIVTVVLENQEGRQLSVDHNNIPPSETGKYFLRKGKLVPAD